MADTSLASLFSFSFSSRSTSSCKDSRITSLTFTPRLDSFFLSSAGTLAHTVSVAIRYYQNSIMERYDKKVTTIPKFNTWSWGWELNPAQVVDIANSAYFYAATFPFL